MANSNHFIRLQNFSVFFHAALPQLLIFILLPTIFILNGCKNDKDKHATPPPAPVKVTKAEAKDTPVTLKAIGNVKASTSVIIKSRVDGHILRIHFLSGDTIKAGQLLYTIDPETYEYKQKGALADVASDRATADMARKEYIRYKDLYEQSVISKEEYDQKITAYQTARKAMEADTAQADIAGRNVKFTRITSPIDGIAGSSILDEGNLVAADKDELLVIKTISPASVDLYIPGHEFNLVRSHLLDDELPVYAQPASMNVEPAKGVVTYVDNWINPDTGMIKVGSSFTNEDRKLWPGMFVSVDVVLDTKKDAVRIPSQAIQRGPKGKYVYIIKDDKAVMRPVTVGMRIDDDVVIDKGVNADETVVIEGMLRLFPDAPVTIKKDEATDSASADGGKS